MKHILTDDEMRKALWEKPRPVDIDDIVMVTRFLSEDNAIQLIADTLSANISDIESWLLSDTDKDYVAYATFDHITGDGLVKNTDWTKPIPVHGVHVIIRKDFKDIYKSFNIVTAYPIRTMYDVDDIYDAIEEYINRKSV